VFGKDVPRRRERDCSAPDFACLLHCPHWRESPPDRSPREPARSSLVIAGSGRLGSPRFAAGVNTGLETSATTMFWVFAPDRNRSRSEVRYCFTRISCNCTPLASGRAGRVHSIGGCGITGIRQRIARVRDRGISNRWIGDGRIRDRRFVMAGLVIAGFRNRRVQCAQHGRIGDRRVRDRWIRYSGVRNRRIGDRGRKDRRNPPVA